MLQPSSPYWCYCHEAGRAANAPRNERVGRHPPISLTPERGQKRFRLGMPWVTLWPLTVSVFVACCRGVCFSQIHMRFKCPINFIGPTPTNVPNLLYGYLSTSFGKSRTLTLAILANTTDMMVFRLHGVFPWFRKPPQENPT